MGALGRVRRKVEGAEVLEPGERVLVAAIEKAAKMRGITAEAYFDLALLFALEADGVVHVQRKGDRLDVCFASEECSGHA